MAPNEWRSRDSAGHRAHAKDQPCTVDRVPRRRRRPSPNSIHPFLVSPLLKRSFLIGSRKDFVTGSSSAICSSLRFVFCSSALLLFISMPVSRGQVFEENRIDVEACGEGKILCEVDSRRNCIPVEDFCDKTKALLFSGQTASTDQRREKEDASNPQSWNTMIVILVSVIGGIVVINLILLIICVFRRLDARRSSRTPTTDPTNVLEAPGGVGDMEAALGGRGPRGSRAQTNRGTTSTSGVRRDNNNGGESQSVAPSLYTNGSLSELHTYPYPSLESIRTNSLRSGGHPPTYSDVFPWSGLGPHTLDRSSLNTLSYNTIDRTLGGSISPDEKPPEYLELCGEITEAFLTSHCGPGSSHPIERSRSENDLRISPLRTPPLDGFGAGDRRSNDDSDSPCLNA